jgi:hypothetical protein
MPEVSITTDASKVQAPAPAAKPEALGSKTDKVVGEYTPFEVIHDQLGFDSIERFVSTWVPETAPEKPVLQLAGQSLDKVLGLLNLVPAQLSNAMLGNSTKALREAGYSTETIRSLQAGQDLANQLLTGLVSGPGEGVKAATALAGLLPMALGVIRKLEPAAQGLQATRNARTTVEAVATSVKQTRQAFTAARDLAAAQAPKAGEVALTEARSLEMGMGHVIVAEAQRLKVTPEAVEQAMLGLSQALGESSAGALGHVVGQRLSNAQEAALLFGPGVGDQAGRVKTGVLVSLAGAVAGAAAGGATGEDLTSRFERALIGAGLGAAAPMVARRLSQWWAKSPLRVPMPGQPSRFPQPLPVVPPSPVPLGPAGPSRVNPLFAVSRADAKAIVLDLVRGNRPAVTKQLQDLSLHLDLSRLTGNAVTDAEAVVEGLARILKPSFEAVRGTTTLKAIRGDAAKLGLGDVVDLLAEGSKGDTPLNAVETWKLISAFAVLDQRLVQEAHAIVGGGGGSMAEAVKLAQATGAVALKLRGAISEAGRVLRVTQEAPGVSTKLLMADQLATLMDASPAVQRVTLRAYQALPKPGGRALFASQLFDAGTLTVRAVQEMWKNGLLTSVRGMGANIASTINLMIDRPLAMGLVSVVQGMQRAVGHGPAPESTVYLGEVGAYGFGMMTGIWDGLIGAGRLVIGNGSDLQRALGGGVSAFAEKVKTTSQVLSFQNLQQIQNPLLKTLATLPVALNEALALGARTFIMAPDEAARSMLYAAMRYANAYHESVNLAKAERVAGQATARLWDHFLGQLQDVGPATEVPRKLARVQAEIAAYSSGLGGPMMEAISKLGQSPVWGFFAPFGRAMVNMGFTGLEHLPLGYAASARAQKVIELGGEVERHIYQAQGVTGLAFIGAGTYMAVTGRVAAWTRAMASTMGLPIPEWAQQTPQIDGAGPLHPDSKRAWKDAGGKPDTIFFPGLGEGLTLDRLGIYGKLLSYGAEMADVASQYRGSDLDAALTGAALSVGRYLTDPNFAGPLRQIMESWADFTAKPWTTIGKQYLTSVLPTLVRQAEAKIDPTLRAEWDHTTDFAHNALRQIKANIPGLSKTVEPRLDLWGAVDLSPQGWLPPDTPKGIGWLDMLNPAMAVQRITDPATREIIANQMKLATPDPFLFGPRPGEWGQDSSKEGIPLTAAQHNRLIKLQATETTLPVGERFNDLFGTKLPDAVGLHDLLNGVTASPMYQGKVPMMGSEDLQFTPGPDGSRTRLFTAITNAYRQASEIALVNEDAKGGGVLANQYLALMRQRLVAMFGPQVLQRLPTADEMQTRFKAEINTALTDLGVRP